MEILVVEDEKISRDMLVHFLEGLGYRVHAVADGEQAYEAFQARKSRLIISDWMLPKMDGLRLCRQIREYDSDFYTYFLIITKREEREDYLEIFNSGADDYISKPFDPPELKARLQTATRIIELESNHNRMQKVLRASRDKLKTVFDALNEEIVAVDVDLRVISGNRAFQEMLQMDFNKFVVRPIDELLNGMGTLGVLPDKINARLRQVFESGQGNTGDEFYYGPDKEKYYCALSCLPVKDSRGSVDQVVIVSKDVTADRRRAAEIQHLNQQLKKAVDEVGEKNEQLESTLSQLRSSQAQILQSEKMASIGQLAAGVAHEINNPTGFVSSNLKTLSEYQEDIQQMIGAYRELKTHLEADDAARLPNDALKGLLEKVNAVESDIDLEFLIEDIQALVEESREGTDRIRKIVIDLKDFAHPGSDDPELSDINEKIESTINIVWNELKYNVTLDKQFGELPMIWCFPSQIGQVFMNLVVNAAQAIETQGTICVTTWTDNGDILVTVEDDGSGISPEHLDDIFNPFFTTKEVGKGTGLGLNLVYNIVQRHNGHIDVKSTVGKGTKFTVRLPANHDWEEQPPVSDGTPQAVPA